MPFWKFQNIAASETEPEHAELRIEGDIIDNEDAWLYEWFGIQAVSPNAFKADLSQYDGKPITVWIDSYGGSVFAATGIYNALQEHKADVTVKIDGKAMSAATIIAMAGKDILMSPTAMMMIHNPLTEAYGYASDLRKTADVLDEVKDAIINAYQLKTGRSRAKLSEMMNGETYMSAKTAIKEGFATGMLYADSEAKPVEMAFNRHAILNSTSEAVKRMVAMQKPPDPQKPDNSKARALLALEMEL
ncbi:head maturation protease, ClpP-related [Papillibacter cinnamivorans]|uniref:ATP-dependent Clp protease proteolytic subunit n=1 Tax=Papillibacter cinnamivorans DSM 12816 TaxID=1122930 RepID=A0A1W1YQQ7_9FIRM|nr:head maturation protease, ClpP-related [Papillibacter cinnamivorans]SMC38489.1 ATP-dependent Clp protease, protease subunit [Papillibacter cinnamivorans DSM 12816]